MLSYSDVRSGGTPSSQSTARYSTARCSGVRSLSAGQPTAVSASRILVSGRSAMRRPQPQRSASSSASSNAANTLSAAVCGTRPPAEYRRGCSLDPSSSSCVMAPLRPIRCAISHTSPSCAPGPSTLPMSAQRLMRQDSRYDQHGTTQQAIFARAR